MMFQISFHTDTVCQRARKKLKSINGSYYCIMILHLDLDSFFASADLTRNVDLIGKPVDENLNVIGHLSQRTMLVRGQNNRDVWGHDTDRMAVVAAEAVPEPVEKPP